MKQTLKSGDNWIYDNPVSAGYRITSMYLSYDIDYDGDGDKDPHYAIDIAVPVGTKVTSPFDGTVVKVNNTNLKKGYGRYIVIQRNKNTDRFWFGHLSATKVEVGDTIVRGQLLGLSGNTGFSTGPHLHFERRKAPYRWGTVTDPGDRVDPLPAVRTRWQNAQANVRAAGTTTKQVAKTKPAVLLTGLTGLAFPHLTGLETEYIDDTTNFVVNSFTNDPVISSIVAGMVLTGGVLAYHFNKGFRKTVNAGAHLAGDKLKDMVNA